MTDIEFKLRWKKLKDKQRRFVLEYLKTLDPKQAAINAGYSPSFIEAPTYRIMRRVSGVIDYLVDKNQIIKNIVKPEFVLNEYVKLYERTKNEMTKQNVLRELSKILQMQNNNNTSVEITNNIPTVPVQIVFNDEE